MSADSILNVLADRYASPEMRAVWSPRGRIGLERDLWIAVMKAQADLGLDISAAAIRDYEKVRDQIDLASIDKRERALLHDVKARIEEFNGLAGHECIHLGMTSRDLTENVEQLQVFRGLQLLRVKAIAALHRLADRAKRTRTLLVTGRTHNVPAQPTTFGKRLAMFGEELLVAVERLDQLVARYPGRGLKGAVGTQLDQTTLFDGSAAKAAKLEQRLMKHLGLKRVAGAVGQVYPRSLDFDVVSTLHQLGAGAGSFATTVRLMAGYGLMTEGFKKGQVGSSAMPHKVNCRNCERIHGFLTILAGHVTMASGLAGDQWNEGDVSCSVVRRVVLPDAFYAIDGLLETFLTVLDQFEVFTASIRAENERQLPFLATTTILMEAVKAGAGRETAHAAIKEHALAAAREMREGSGDGAMLERIASDARLGLSKARLSAILGDGERFFGAAPAQVDAFVETVRGWTRRFPAARKLQPAPLL
ncbi:adenylosuccinate lyase [Opitutales bacterium ASA1]|uniref:adenylosuccinate lyase n=1 Tax=Congregicoccus parvus TaxID=3081749 RepID=UPI002B317EFB|nr:adenylosuccinate lyase [Opitutales bacterium ASA1]